MFQLVDVPGDLRPVRTLLLSLVQLRSQPLNLQVAQSNMADLGSGPMPTSRLAPEWLMHCMHVMFWSTSYGREHVLP